MFSKDEDRKALAALLQAMLNREAAEESVRLFGASRGRGQTAEATHAEYMKLLAEAATVFSK